MPTRDIHLSVELPGAIYYKSAYTVEGGINSHLYFGVICPIGGPLK